jgi:hypothetical protein
MPRFIDGSGDSRATPVSGLVYDGVDESNALSTLKRILPYVDNE